MYKLKKYSYYKNILLNYDILYINNLIYNNDFIIYINCLKLSNFLMASGSFGIFDDYINNYDNISLVLTKKYINKIFNRHFKFLSSDIFCIFTSDLNKFLNIIKILKGVSFFYSFKRNFSPLLNSNIILNQVEKYKNFQLFHYILFKLIFNIIILMLYYIVLIIKYLK